MPVHVDGEFFRDETWLIQGIVYKDVNVPADLTGGQVKFRLLKGAVIMIEKIASLISPSEGVYEVVIPESEQDAFVDKAYAYEVKAFFADTTSSVQNYGVIKVKPSKFQTL